MSEDKILEEALKVLGWQSLQQYKETKGLTWVDNLSKEPMLDFGRECIRLSVAAERERWQPVYDALEELRDAVEGLPDKYLTADVVEALATASGMLIAYGRALSEGGKA